MRYIFYALLVLINLSGITHGDIASIVFVANLTFVMYYINKLEQRKKDQGLIGNDKLVIILTEVLNPLVAGAFYYYCLKKKLPKTASQANKYSWIIFGIMFVAFVAAIVFAGATGYKMMR